jgi:hypothetical protein
MYFPQVKLKPDFGNIELIEPRDTLRVTIGNQENWWEDDWYKNLTGASVVVGLFF